MNNIEFFLAYCELNQSNFKSIVKNIYQTFKILWFESLVESQILTNKA